jgi:quercetin dioxygenase-like cupin family protein
MNKFEDERGIIEDLKVGKDWSVTYISFKEGAVRGNHRHAKTIQTDVVLSGSFLCCDEKRHWIVKPGDSVTHLPEVAHAYRALEDSEMVSTCNGVRIGENYEEDTFRLSPEEKLL